MSAKRSTLAKLLLGACLAALVAGCSKLTPENYSKLKMGMDYAEVVKTIGKPSECSAVLNAQNCRWKDGDKEVEVKLVSDKVVFVSGSGL